MKIKYLIFLLPALYYLTACEKPPGVGGTSSIKGTVIQQDFNNSNELEDSFGAPDESVYIIFGEDEIYSDDMKTHYDGKYIFSRLRKGKYKLFAYSECIGDTCDAPNIPVFINVEIKENNQEFNADEIFINNY